MTVESAPYIKNMGLVSTLPMSLNYINYVLPNQHSTYVSRIITFVCLGGVLYQTSPYESISD